jgi:DNA-directed RNA polymerase specialized sigma24 family protein
VRGISIDRILADRLLAPLADRLLRVAYAQARRHGLTSSEADDIAADALAQVALKSLPRFDESRGSVRGYLVVCIRNAATTLSRRHLRRRRPPVIASESIERDGRNAKPLTPALDRRIETVALLVFRCPERLGFTARQCEVLRAVLHPKRPTLAVVARRLGYAAPAQLSRILSRIRGRLLALDLPNCAIDGPYIHQPCPIARRHPEPNPSASGPQTAGSAPRAAATTVATRHGAGRSSAAIPCASSAANAAASGRRRSPTTSSRSRSTRTAAST